ncbi:hypothetical protein [Candidatus Methylospira mobilis]|uniref:hypothetical protein n=1 Tax=Candidatus Methylospira mobilis TaxID=1808979 RepID=UPI0018857385|nr:hypothetical protein [Candidatus Methylospira mobilis]
MTIEKMLVQLSKWENLKANVDHEIAVQKKRIHNELVMQIFHPMRYWWETAGHQLYRR